MAEDKDPAGQRCGANKHGNVPCNAFALRGSIPPRCRIHVGRKGVAAVKAEADLRLGAEAALARLGEPSPIGDPLDRLLELAAEQDQWLGVIRERVQELRSLTQSGLDGVERERALVLVYERALDRTTKTLVEIARLGIEDRMVRVTESNTARLLGVVRFALVELGHDPNDETVLAALRKGIAATEPRVYKG